MPIEELIARPVTGIEPFNELPIDAEIWREAHGQHTQHRMLHAVSAHRPGIVYGLEVIVAAQERTIVVAPGVGVDALGRTLVISQPVQFTLEEKGQWYITLSFEDNVDSKSAITVGSGKKYYRLVEGRQVVATREIPATPYLELARLDRTTSKAKVKEPANPFDPGEDELNLLYRQTAFPSCYADGAVGELCFLPKPDPNAWKPNRAGLCNFLRESNTAGFHLRFSGLFNLKGATPNDAPLLLYVAGQHEFQALTKDQLDGLSRYLEAGGMLLGESTKGGQAFADGFGEVAAKVGATLKEVKTGHPLLSAHHVFSSCPAGSEDKGAVLADLNAGVIFTSFDFGGAWQGKLGKELPDGRLRIRQSMEFGANIVAAAAKRRRQIELMRLV